VQAWRQVDLDVVVSLLTRNEVADLELGREAELSQAKEIEFFVLPIPDRSVPISQRAILELVRNLQQFLVVGKNVGIHCRQGIGRAAVVAACLLVFSGIDLGTAFRRISTARKWAVPETAEQREWVVAFARELQEPSRIPRAVCPYARNMLGFSIP